MLTPALAWADIGDVRNSIKEKKKREEEINSRPYLANICQGSQTSTPVKPVNSLQIWNNMEVVHTRETVTLIFFIVELIIRQL